MRALGAVWLVAALAGLAWLARYDNAPGVSAHAAASWPSATRLVRDTSGPTVVMVAHPLCTCTAASLAELAEIMARASHRPRAYVVFIGLSATASEPTELAEAAAAIEGVTVVQDRDGREAAAFGAETSGQTFVYDAGGDLQFSGGTTGSRGHRGDNVGRAMVLAALNRTPVSQATWSVFGCSLFAPGASRGSGGSPTDVPGSN